jgi:hypothetical protein
MVVDQKGNIHLAKMVTGGRASDLKRLQLRMCAAVRVQRQVWGSEKRERAREREREREPGRRTEMRCG